MLKFNKRIPPQKQKQKLFLIKNIFLSNKNTISSQLVNTQFLTQKNVGVISLDSKTSNQNPIDAEMADYITKSLKHFNDDKSVNTILIRSNHKSFSVGMDLTLLKNARKLLLDRESPKMPQNFRLLKNAENSVYRNSQNLRDFENNAANNKPPKFSTATRMAASISKILDLPEVFSVVKKPIVASVKGFALGGGFEMALLSDIVVAAENAVFAFPEINLGLFPGMDGSRLLAAEVGRKRAAEAVLTGRRIRAREALAMGVASRVVAVEAADKTALEVAQSVASRGPRAVGSVKRSLCMGGRSRDADKEAFWECLRG